MSDKKNLLSFNMIFKQTSMNTLLTSTATFLQENPEFKSHLRDCDQHTELKKLHEENTALLLALRISQRETEIHKESSNKWRLQCEKLLLESRNTITNQAVEERVERVKRHHNEWAKDFDYSSSDEEEE